jgi:hypothetical protein
MNAFAHSVDEFIGDVDVGQTITLMIELSQLESATRNTKLHLVDCRPVVIYTIHYFLENLIYHVLNFSLRGAGPEDEIRISFDSSDDEVKISFSGIAANIVGEFPTMKEALLAKILSANVFFDTPAGKLNVVLPKKIPESFIQSIIAV